MLMATTLSSVRTGRCFRFSTTSLLIKLFVGYDYTLPSMGGVTRPSFGTNSSVTARPPGDNTRELSIEGYDFGVGTVLCDGDAEESVAGSDVQHFPFLARIGGG